MLNTKKEYRIFKSNVGLILAVTSGALIMSGCNNKQQYDYSTNPPAQVQHDERFVYETYIEADLNNQYKADIYVAKNLTIEQVKDIIIERIKSPIESIDTNIEDGSVAIVTERYYIMIYKSDDNETLVQVSEREYVYNSRNHLYHSPLYARSFYRDYYYYKCYKNDHNRFGSTKNAFNDFMPSTSKLNVVSDIDQNSKANKATTMPNSSNINKETIVPKKVDINKTTSVPKDSGKSNKTNDNYINNSNNKVKDNNINNTNNTTRKKSNTTTKKSRRRR